MPSSRASLRRDCRASRYSFDDEVEVEDCSPDVAEAFAIFVRRGRRRLFAPAPRVDDPEQVRRTLKRKKASPAVAVAAQSIRLARRARLEKRERERDSERMAGIHSRHRRRKRRRKKSKIQSHQPCERDSRSTNMLDAADSSRA